MNYLVAALSLIVDYHHNHRKTLVNWSSNYQAKDPHFSSPLPKQKTAFQSLYNKNN